MNKTTLYNHNTLGTADKPLIKNVQLKQLIDRIENGEVDLYEKAISSFSFEQTQKRLLETTYLNAKK